MRKRSSFPALKDEGEVIASRDGAKLVKRLDGKLELKRSIHPAPSGWHSQRDVRREQWDCHKVI
jgi:hypothetical protein